MALTLKQENFVLAYLESGNSSAAYRSAYNTVSMKDETIWSKASLLLDDDKVRARLKELRKPVIEKAQLTLEQILSENSKIAFFDIRTIFDANGNVKPVAAWDETIGGAVSSIEVKELYEGTGKDRISVGQTKKITFWDKGAALDKLMKHLGGYEAYNKQKDSSPLQELVQAIMGTSLPVVKDISSIDMEDDD